MAYYPFWGSDLLYYPAYMNSKRTIYCEDAIEWLSKNTIIPHASIVSSMPDFSEFQGMPLADWKNWFISTAKLILEKTDENQVSIFYQSDIKHQGRWVDKSYLCMKAAELVGSELLWHKIICRARPGITTFGRPAYSHIICFSKKLRLDPKNSTPDIIPIMGEKIWERGMAPEASIMIAKFIKDQTTSQILINPFCGKGTMIAIANSFDLFTVGIEKNSKRAHFASSLEFNLNSREWLKSGLD